MKFKSLFLSAAIGLLIPFSYAQKPPEPFGPIPNANQLRWKQMEYYMFIHFGPNTFTNKEWGHGNEDPKVFNPTSLDAEQWARTAKVAGMKAIIITAKHHDGFCLFPSRYSTHTVRESLWKNGKGDVLKELAAACKKYGLKMGVYLSPWDRNHPDYGTEKYNQIFANTLQEVLGNYGEIFEQWFDGANGEGPNGKKVAYDWDLFRGVVYKNQPGAVIFSDIGPGVRWTGNEKGIAGLTNWSTINTDGYQIGPLSPPWRRLNQGNENGKYWIPSECDVSIRPGWFYSPETDDKVKTLDQLLSIYHASVGRNANLLLNVPVDRRGLIAVPDSLRLMELRKALDDEFKVNLAKGKKVSVSNTRGNSAQFAGSKLVDGAFESYWCSDDRIKTASITIDLGVSTTFNRVVLQEYIKLGQRVKSFKVSYLHDGSWKQIDMQTTVGYKRIFSFPDVTGTKLRIDVLEAKACPVVSEIGIYRSKGKVPELLMATFPPQQDKP